MSTSREKMPPTLKDHPIKPGMLLFGESHYYLVAGVYLEKVRVHIDTDGTMRDFPNPDECLKKYEVLDLFEGYVPPTWLKTGAAFEGAKVRGVHGKHVRFVEVRPDGTSKGGGFLVLPAEVFIEVHDWQGASRFDRNDPV